MVIVLELRMASGDAVVGCGMVPIRVSALRGPQKKAA
jgi:hypothetical protein